MNWFKLFAFKRKLDIFCPFEAFFELHSPEFSGLRKDKKAKNGRKRTPEASGFSKWKKFKPPVQWKQPKVDPKLNYHRLRTNILHSLYANRFTLFSLPIVIGTAYSVWQKASQTKVFA